MLDFPLFQLYCRHYIWEIQLSHVLVGLLGKPGPRRDEYMLLKNNWPSLEQDINNSDQNRLVRFDCVSTAGIDSTSFLMIKAM